MTTATATSIMSSASLKPHHHILTKTPHPKSLSFRFIKNPYPSLPFNTPTFNSLTTTCRLQFSSFPSNFHRHKQHFRHRAYDNGAGHKVNLDNDFNFDYLLSVGELVCLVSSAVISVIFAVKRRVFGAMGGRVLMLAVAMLALGAGLGAWIRKRQWRRVFRESVRSSGGGEGLNLVERVEKLEEDLKSSATIIRVLSRQLEKLGIRFRVTRKALKEPIAETAALAQKNSEATRALAIQEDILEKELGEIQKVLLAMQEQQQKQLDLILAIGKTGKLSESLRGPDQEEDTTRVYSWAKDGVKQTETHQTPASSVRKVSENDMA